MGLYFTLSELHSFQDRWVVFPVGANDAASTDVFCLQVLHQISRCEKIIQKKNSDYYPSRALHKRDLFFEIAHCLSDSCPSRLESMEHNRCQCQQEAKL